MNWDNIFDKLSLNTNSAFATPLPDEFFYKDMVSKEDTYHFIYPISISGEAYIQTSSLCRECETQPLGETKSLQKIIVDFQNVLEDGTNEERVAAVETLGKLEKPPVLLLLQALVDPYWDVRAAAAQALGNLGERIPTKHLIARLKQEPDISVRETIVRVLGQQNNTTLVNVFTEVLRHDESWIVREAAVWALGELGERSPLHVLFHTMRFDPDEDVRSAAALALARSKAQEAIVPLFQALNDAHQCVQDAAVFALLKIDEETYERDHQHTVIALENDDLSFLEQWDPFGSTIDIQQEKELRAWFALVQFVADKKGGVKAKLQETPQGQVLLIECFYESTEDLFQDVLLPSIEDHSFVAPVEVALNKRDDIMHIVVEEALERKKRQKCLDLLIVSFFVIDKKNAGYTPPLRVIFSIMACRDIGEKDSLVIEQILDGWRSNVNTPFVCDYPQNLLNLKVWYQPTIDTPLLERIGS